jgi:hypothetical protein
MPAGYSVKRFDLLLSSFVIIVIIKDVKDAYKGSILSEEFKVSSKRSLNLLVRSYLFRL